MIAKLIGALLLVGGILLALPLAWMATLWLFSSLWMMAKVLGAAALIWCGWQWLNSRGAAKQVSG